MPEHKLIMGIDPGASGGIAVISLHGIFYDASRMPETERDIIDTLQLYIADGTIAAYLEAVHSFPGQGISSSFTFGKGYGFIRGVLITRGIPLIDVSPMKWKKSMGLIYHASDSKKDKKNGSKALCQQLFPNLKVTHATAEAMLLAEFGRRTYK